MRELHWENHLPYKILIPLARKLKNSFNTYEDTPFESIEPRTRTFIVSPEKPKEGIDAVYIEEEA